MAVVACIVFVQTVLEVLHERKHVYELLVLVVVDHNLKKGQSKIVVVAGQALELNRIVVVVAEGLHSSN